MLTAVFFLALIGTGTAVPPEGNSSLTATAHHGSDSKAQQLHCFISKVFARNAAYIVFAKNFSPQNQPPKELKFANAWNSDAVIHEKSL